ncbi:MAG: helix-turn-helix transcriptional regulator [Spirochaetales bacterium]|nr:helix-turn-helix transcriptional regulator [Spirochaetales bacterium]
MADKPILSELYAISLKNGQDCSMLYGRRNYDFQEGIILFLAPGQIMAPLKGEKERKDASFSSWTLVFHPDLIRSFPLKKQMPDYTFFHYDSNEMLHLSEQERITLTDLAYSIQKEFSKNIDDHSCRIIVSQIELMLNFCSRYYSRQFITRSTENKDILIRFESFLKDYFDSGQLKKNGLLNVELCAKELGYSSHYLSDLLKKETGRNAREHIQLFVIEKAKDLLLSTDEPVNIIAYSLGFEYPQHFSKLFKHKVGVPPRYYRVHR